MSVCGARSGLGVPWGVSRAALIGKLLLAEGWVLTEIKSVCVCSLKTVGLPLRATWCVHGRCDGCEVCVFCAADFMLVGLSIPVQLRATVLCFVRADFARAAKVWSVEQRL